MKTKKIMGIMLILAMTAVLFMSAIIPASAAAATSGSIDAVTIAGSVNNKITTQYITVTINGEGFKDISNNLPVSDWFVDSSGNNNFPGGLTGGLTANAEKAITDGTKSFRIKIDGTPTESSIDSIRIAIPKEHIKEGDGTATAGITISPGNAKWNIKDTAEVTFSAVQNPTIFEPSLSYSVKPKTEGTLTAKVGTTTITSGAYVAVGDTITFTATLPTKPTTTSNINYRIQGWTLNESDTMEKDSDNNKITTKTYIYKVKETDVGTAAINVKVAFEEGATAYRIDPLNAKYGDEEDFHLFDDWKNDKVTPFYDKDKNELKMNFGESITINIPTVTTNKLITEAAGSAPPVYEDAYDEDSIENDDSDDEVYKYKFKDPVSSNKAVAAIEFVPDTNTFTGSFKINARSEGTAKITVEVTHVSGEPKLENGKIEFTVIVGTVTAVTIDESNPLVIIATTTVIESNQPKSIEINLEKEIVINKTGTMLKGYSLDGTKWYEIEIYNNTSGTDISQIFDKGGSNVKFTEKLENGKPAAGSAIWTIGKINARPAAPKLTVWYGDGKQGFENIDNWYYKGIPNNTDLYYALSDDGKNVDKDDWKAYYEYKELSVEATSSIDEDVGEDEDEDVGEVPDSPVVEKVRQEPTGTPIENFTDKVTKSYYFAKYAPKIEFELNDTGSVTEKIKALTPFSKTSKVTVSSFLKPPKVKVNYKKEIITMKAGIYYAVGQNNDDYVMMTSANSKKGIKFNGVGGIFSDGITIGGKEIVKVYTGSTGKKPRSATTEVTVNYYTTFKGDPTIGFDETKHKFKVPKGYEVYDEVKKKWVTSIKITKTIPSLKIREKGNAKYDPNGEDDLKSGSYPASEEKYIMIVWDDCPTNKPTKMKKGVKEVIEVQKPQ